MAFYRHRRLRSGSQATASSHPARIAPGVKLLTRGLVQAVAGTPRRRPRARRLRPLHVIAILVGALGAPLTTVEAQAEASPLPDTPEPAEAVAPGLEMNEPVPPEATAPKPPASRSLEEEEREARRLFDDGQEVRAAERYSQLYDRYPHPNYLFNAATALQVYDPQRAIALCKQVRAHPGTTAHIRQLAEALLKKLQPPSSPPPIPSPPPALAPNAAEWILMAAGAVLVVGGGIATTAYWLEANAKRDLGGYCRRGVCSEQGGRRYDEAVRAATAGNLSLGVAAAGAALGVLGLIGWQGWLSSDDAGESALRIAIAPEDAFVRFSHAL